MTFVEDRILMHLQDGKRIPVDPQEIFLLEAEGGETRKRCQACARPSLGKGEEMT